jgi:hypothetical protein
MYTIVGSITRALRKGLVKASWREELSWAAGFFDGEGCCSTAYKNNRPLLLVGQHYDPVCLIRFQKAVLGVGKIYGPYSYSTRKNNGPSYMWRTTNFEHSQAVVAMLWKFLSEPKRAAIEEAFIDYKIEYGRIKSRRNSHRR